MKRGAERVVYAGYLGDTAAALYTYTGVGSSFSRVRRIRLTNTDAAAIVVHVSIVPSGGTLSDVTYAEVTSLELAEAGADEHVLEYEPESEISGIKLRNGEAIVAWAATANKIAARVEVEDVT